MSLEKFLAKKPLFYKEIDYDRMPNAYKSIKGHFKLPKIIHIVGTNAKGTTGRYLASLLKHNGYKTGHYSSPHILKFNERIWIDGKDVDDEILNEYHKRLQKLLHVRVFESLSYFEYTTLLAMLIFQDFCDYVVLEAGLGGERDATNVFDKELSIVTPIGFDHQEFLGNSLKEIATTKLKSIKNRALIAEQKYDEVYEISSKLLKKRKIDYFFVEDVLKDDKEIDKFLDLKNIEGFLRENFKTAYAATKLLGMDTQLSEELNIRSLRGRIEKISKNIYLDVGHNLLSAKAISEYFSGKKVILIYNSFTDKDFKSVLKELSRIIKSVKVLPIESTRTMANEEICKVCKELKIECDIGTGRINNEDIYLVYGSFSVAEKFIKDFFER